VAFITIKDVAKKAHVSVATVSRVINGNDSVDEGLKQKVQDAIKALGFKPNQLARSLKKDVTNTIGVVVSDISNSFFINVARVIEKRIAPHGYMIIMASTDSSSEKELRYISMMQEKRVDGLIISPDIGTPEHLDSLGGVGCPVVCIDRKSLSSVYDSVYVDKAKSTEDLVSLLIRRGHERIALVTGPKELSTNYDRFSGYAKAMYDHDITFKNDYMLFGRFDEEWGRESLRRLMTMPKRPTAIVSGSGIITNGILLEATESGVRIPDDMSLVSFGEIPMQPLISPKITYVESLVEQIGTIAGDMIISRIAEPSQPRKEKILSAKIIEGSSVNDLRRDVAGSPRSGGGGSALSANAAAIDDPEVGE